MDRSGGESLFARTLQRAEEQEEAGGDIPFGDCLMQPTRRTLMRYLYVFMACTCFILFPGSSHWSWAQVANKTTGGTTTAPPPPEKESQEVAYSFLEKISGKSAENIRSMKLSYDVHLELESFVNVKMSVILEMKKEKNDYVSIFSLTEPVGEDLWSRFALFIYGRHTEEYRQMVKGIEVKLSERFRLEDKKFVTEELREILPEVKKYENQTGMRIYFDYSEREIKFWEDQTKKRYDKEIELTNQVGPMTGFFNFILFGKPEAEISIINALKRAKSVTDSGDGSPQKVNIDFTFGSQVVRLQHNDTGRHMEYHNAIYFQHEDYLDLIYGKNIYYHLARNDNSDVKVPYEVVLDGIISKAKKREKERRLRLRTERPMEHEIVEEELKNLNPLDELVARNVKVYLRKAAVLFD